MSDWAFLMACMSLLLSGICIMVYKSFQDDYQRKLKKMNIRINYLELVLHHHGLTPLSWEMEELHEQQSKSLKKEGNVIYLKE